MEANTFIKSVEVEGNKIKDIKFYGDWQLDMGSGNSGAISFGDPRVPIVDAFDDFCSIEKANSKTFLTITSPVDTQVFYFYSAANVETFFAVSEKHTTIAANGTVSINLPVYMLNKMQVLLMHGNKLLKMYIFNPDFLGQFK
jgi:hypothetical protein